MPPVIDKEKCSRCHVCVEICPQDVFYGSKKGEIPQVKYPDECWHCNACVLDCPQKAIRLFLPLSMQLLLGPEFEEK